MKHITLDELNRIATNIISRLMDGNESAAEMIALLTLLDTLRETIFQRSVPQEGYTVELLDRGSLWISVIKELRTRIPGLGLADAKAMTENLPKVVVKKVSLTVAQEWVNLLESKGAKVKMSPPLEVENIAQIYAYDA